jgi:PAS domain S-box-containing protein
VEGLVYDVTEREQAEEWLREAEERYRTLVERLPAIVYVQEPDEPSRTTYVSPQVEAVLGYSPEECLADPDHWIKILHPDDRERVLEEDRRTNDFGDSFATEYRQFAKDGRLVWLRDEATLVRGEEGEPLYWLGVQTDVTERKEAEEAARRSEERLRSLADAAFEGILISDGGEILEANRALTDMLGYETMELFGRSALEFVAPDHRDLVRNKFASGAEEPYEIVGVRKDGTRLDLEVRGRAYSYRGRDVRVTAVRDVTERKAAEDRCGRRRSATAPWSSAYPPSPSSTVPTARRSPSTSAPRSKRCSATPRRSGRPETVAGAPAHRRPGAGARLRRALRGSGEPVDEEYRLLAKDGVGGLGA